MNNKIYISGPMSGIEGYNASSFFRADKLMKTKGFEPVNPFDVGNNANIPEDSTIEEKYLLFMKADIAALMDCDSIYMLDGHKDSKGAKMELSIANFFNMSVYYEYLNGEKNGDS